MYYHPGPIEDPEGTQMSLIVYTVDVLRPEFQSLRNPSRTLVPVTKERDIIS